MNISTVLFFVLSFVVALVKIQKFKFTYEYVLVVSSKIDFFNSKMFFFVLNETLSLAYKLLMSCLINYRFLSLKM